MPPKSSKKRTRAESPQRPISIADLSRFQLVSSPQISPDGRQILFQKTEFGPDNNYLKNLWLIETNGSSCRQLTRSGKDGFGRWNQDGSALAFISSRVKGNPQIYLMAMSGGEPIPLTSLPEGSLRDLAWSPDGTQIAFSFRETASEWTSSEQARRGEEQLSPPPRVITELYYRHDGDGYFQDQRYALYVVDIATKECRAVFSEDTMGSFSYDWAPNSKQIVLTANTNRQALLKPWKEELLILEVATRKTTRIPDQPVGTKSCVRWSPDGSRIAFIGREGKQSIWGVANDQLWVYNIPSKEYLCLTDDEDYCLSVSVISDMREVSSGQNLEWDPDGKRLYFTIGWHGAVQVASIAVDGGLMQFHTTGQGAHTLGGISATTRLAAVTIEDVTCPAEIACVHLSDHPVPWVVNRLTDFNAPLLKELELSAPEEAWVDTSDGTRVHTWVLKPIGFRPGKKYPAILEIHGGPHTQYGWSFFHEFQLLAAQEYVVCYSNPRGSKGYGERHCMAIKGRWGQADWRDIEAVTRYLKSLPYVAGKKVGVMGGSYGGYMTNWAISHSQEYAAAITDRCVSNLVSMVGSCDLPLVPGHYWDGNSWDKIEEIWEQSPLRHFGNVKTPTLIIHSEGDLRCNVEQAEQVFTALSLLGVPCRFVRYPDCSSHGMSRCGPPDLRIHRLKEILSWWREYLG